MKEAAITHEALAVPSRSDVLALRACGRALIEVIGDLCDQLHSEGVRPAVVPLRDDLQETRTLVSDVIAQAGAGDVASAFDFLSGKAARVGACFDLAATLRFVSLDVAERGQAVTDALLEDTEALWAATAS